MLTVACELPHREQAFVAWVMMVGGCGTGLVLSSYDTLAVLHSPVSV